MNSIFDTLSLRRPKIDYISPAVCEFPFSASGGPVIVLADISKRHGPTGLILGGTGNSRLSWDSYPGALCYTVYKAVDELDPFGDYQIVAECITDNFIDLDGFGDGIYRVTVITKDGESDPSDAITFTGGGSSSSPLAWFSFDNSTADLTTVDSVAGKTASITNDSTRLLTAIPDLPAKIGNGFSSVKMFYNGALSPFPMDYYIRTLVTQDLSAVDLTSGASLAFWNKHTGFSAVGRTQLDLTIQDAALVTLAVIRFSTEQTNEYIVGIVGQFLETLSLGSGTNHIILRYDATTGKLKLRFNGGADLETTGSYIIPGVAAHCFVTITGSSSFIPANFPLQVDTWFDELSVWPRNLDEPTMTQIYNGGAGQQWPMV